MKKKVIALLLIVAIVATCLVAFAACNNKKGEFTFGLITLHDSSSTYDKNFIDAAQAACNELGVKLIVKSGVEETDACYNTAMDLVDQGCNIIFADSFGHEEYMLKAAKEATGVQFFHATGFRAGTANQANFHDAFASIYQGRYLAGVAAGLKLQAMKAADSTVASKVGYVGAYTYAEVVSGLTSWFLGVQSIVPDVTMDVQFTGSWFDPTAEKTAAETLINQKGAVLLSQHADSMGAPSACEEKKVPDVTYNISTKASCPDTYIIGSKIDWTPYFKMIINKVKNGEAVAADWCGGFNVGAVALTEIGDAAAANTAATLETVKAELLAGTRQVFDCSKIKYNGKTLDQAIADNDVAKDSTSEKPHTLGMYAKYLKTAGTVKYFSESDVSVGTSAPYFDLQIDGINFLNSKF